MCAKPTINPEVFRKITVPVRHAVPAKKITADLDSDDEIICQMKLEGKKDKEIVEFLKNSGRINYRPRTISSRYNRINVVKAAEMDKELDSGRSEWRAVNVSTAIGSSTISFIQLQ